MFAKTNQRRRLFLHLIAPVLILALALAGALGLFPAPAPAADWQSLVQPRGELIQLWNPNQVNGFCRQWDSNIVPGVTDPYDTATLVTEVKTTQTLRFVRFFSGADPRGGWIMRAAEVRGLTQAQIADRFALPIAYPPTNIVLVNVPASTATKNYGLLTGLAGAIWQPGYYWGHGGGTQTRIIKGGTVDPTKYPFIAAFGEYQTYIPVESYIHPQPTGDFALLYGPRVAGGNAGRVAAYLDRFIPAAYSDLEYVYECLDYLNWANYGYGPLRQALRQLTPERYDAFRTVGVRRSLLFGQALGQRSQSLRLGFAGGPGGAGSLADGLGMLAQLAYAGTVSDLRQVMPGMLPAQTTPGGFGLWARGLGEFGGQAGYGERTGFGYRTGGLVAGLDWQPHRNFLVGLGAGYLRTNLDWQNSGGNADQNNVKLGIYGSYFTPRYFIDAALTGGIAWGPANRSIIFEGVNRNALSEQTGRDLAAMVRGGYNFNFKGWMLTPTAELAYIYLNQDPFQEKGAGDVNLRVGAVGAQVLRTQLGARLARTFTTAGGAKIIKEVNIGWAHEFPLDGRGITSNLTALPGSFTVPGAGNDTDSLLVGAAVTAQLANKVSAYGRYDAELRRDFYAHMVNLGLRFDF